jgi:hypothetical protein
MTLRTRVSLATASLIFSLSVCYLIFSKWAPNGDIEAYGVYFVGLLFAVSASVLLYPIRSKFSIRLFGAFAILVAIFWSMEFFGGVAWFLLDKLARLIQRR